MRPFVGSDSILAYDPELLAPSIVALDGDPRAEMDAIGGIDWRNEFGRGPPVHPIAQVAPDARKLLVVILVVEVAVFAGERLHAR